MAKTREEDREQFGNDGARFLLLLEDVLEEGLTCARARDDRDHLPVVPGPNIDGVSLKQVDEKGERRCGSDQANREPFSSMFYWGI
jgi:hypothetical protein